MKQSLSQPVKKSLLQIAREFAAKYHDGPDLSPEIIGVSDHPYYRTYAYATVNVWQVYEDLWYVVGTIEFPNLSGGPMPLGLPKVFSLDVDTQYDETDGCGIPIAVAKEMQNLLFHGFGLLQERGYKVSDEDLKMVREFCD